MCGGDLEISEGMKIAECIYCGTKQTLPKIDNEQRINLYDRANHFRRNNDFDKAMSIYERILNEDNSDAEAYWSLVLCRYGIEYVEDPVTHKRVPTVNRAQYTSIFDDADYKSALEYADTLQSEIYKAEAMQINDIQKGILAISQKEEPFDVFICYKETDSNGRRTQDSVLANDLYHQLTQEGLKVFFSRITLEDKLGTAYEPYIFAALNSAKVMVVVGTKPEYFNAVWVKNEWSRYLYLIKKYNKKMLIPAYRDMDPYDLPEEFSHLQAQDMSKLGFMQDLIRGIKKIVNIETSKTNNNKIKETTSNSEVTPLIKRAFMFLEDSEWKKADEYFERVLDINPEYGEAYLGKLCVELRCRTRKQLGTKESRIDNLPNYTKAMRFGDEALKKELEGYTTSIITKIFNKVYSEENSAETIEELQKIINRYEQIKSFIDVNDRVTECRRKIEDIQLAKKETLYNQILKIQNNAKTIGDFQRVINQYEEIKDFRDVNSKIQECNRKIEDIRLVEKRTIYNQASDIQNFAKTVEDYQRAITFYEKIRDFNYARDRLQKCYVKIAELKKDKIKQKYNKILEAENNAKTIEDLKKVIVQYKELSGFSEVDVDTRIDECNHKIEKLIFVEAEEKYNTALMIENNAKKPKDLVKAISIYEKLSNFKDSTRRIDSCNEKIKKLKKKTMRKRILKILLFILAICVAISIYFGINQFMIIPNKYDKALELYKQGDYYNARNMFIESKGYKDSMKYLHNIYGNSVSIHHSYDEDYIVGLKSDGTVTATGTNLPGYYYGWSDIVSVKAGGKGVVGLKSDGTVVSTISDIDIISSITEWKDIVDISCGSDWVVGLKSDGTVEIAGRAEKKVLGLDSWRDIVNISVGTDHSDYIIGLKSNGTILTSSNISFSTAEKEWNNIAKIDASGNSIVGLKLDRSISSDFFTNEWKEISDISSGENYVAGLKMNGSVIITIVDALYEKSNWKSVNDWKNIVSFDVCQDYIVGLKSDGTVLVAGKSEDIEPIKEIKEWKDIKVPEIRKTK